MTADELFYEVEALLAELGLDLEPEELTLKKNATDYSIKLMKNVILKIKQGDCDHFFIKKAGDMELLERYQADSLKSFPLYHRAWIFLNNDISDLKNYILELYTRSLPDEDVFGCCNEFKMCSDVKSCVKGLKFSVRCMYKKNLDAGRIFYSINKNI